MKKNIHIEGYLFLPFRGQYRFSFELRPQDEGYAFTDMALSGQSYDYFFDSTMRARPTLYELTTTDYAEKFAEARVNQHIMKAFEEIADTIVKTPNVPFKKLLPQMLPEILRPADTYVEFVNVKYHF